MASEPSAQPTGTGQEGAPSPAGSSSGESPTSTYPKSRIQQVANDMAQKGFNRERRDDPASSPNSSAVHNIP